MGPIAQVASWDLTSNVRVKSLMPRLLHLWLGAEIEFSHTFNQQTSPEPLLCARS